MSATLSALIIDASKANRKNLMSILRNGLGVKSVSETESPQLALHFLKEAKDINLICIDYESVNELTFDLVQKCKKLTGNGEIKFVLLANTASKEFLLEAASKGISAFILKPYNAKTIVEKIKKITTSKTERKSSRLSLLEAVNVRLMIDDLQMEGALIDISSGGCLLKSDRLGKAGIDIYDELTIRIPFDAEFVDLQSELIRVERDTSSETQKVSSAFIFKNMNQENALQFAKLWATLLRQNES